MSSEFERQIEVAVSAAVDLSEIEATIIDPAPLDEDEKAALWLYAEALGERRRESMLTGPALAPVES